MIVSSRFFTTFPIPGIEVVTTSDAEGRVVKKGVTCARVFTDLEVANAVVELEKSRTGNQSLRAEEVHVLLQPLPGEWEEFLESQKAAEGVA
jgi:hypothetical protein